MDSTKASDHETTTNWLTQVANEIVQLDTRYRFVMGQSDALLSPEEDSTNITNNKKPGPPTSKSSDQSTMGQSSRNLSIRYPPTKGSRYISTPKLRFNTYHKSSDKQ